MIVFFVLGKSIWLSNSCVRYAKTDGQILQEIYYISSLAQLIMFFVIFAKIKLFLSVLETWMSVTEMANL